MGQGSQGNWGKILSTFLAFRTRPFLTRLPRAPHHKQAFLLNELRCRYEPLWFVSNQISRPLRAIILRGDTVTVPVSKCITVYCKSTVRRAFPKLHAAVQSLHGSASRYIRPYLNLCSKSQQDPKSQQRHARAGFWLGDPPAEVQVRTGATQSDMAWDYHCIREIWQIVVTCSLSRNTHEIFDKSFLYFLSTFTAYIAQDTFINLVHRIRSLKSNGYV